MKRIIGAIFVFVVASVSMQAAVNADIQKIKGNPFKNISYVDGIKQVGNALQIDGDKLFFGAANTLYIFDLKEPQKPRMLGSIELEGLCRQIAVKNNYVFVASRESGLWVVDASDPTNPKFVTRYDPVELPTGIDVYGNVMFLAERINGVEFVDITDPAKPQHIYLQKTSESQSVWYQDGILYSGDWGKHEITAISASDMSDIRILSKTNLWGNGDGVYVQGKYLYAATGHHSYEPDLSKEENFGNGHSLQIFDISVPERPVLLSTTKFAKLYIRSNDYWTARPVADGSMVLMADTFNGVQAIDTKNPRKAKAIGHIDFKDDNGKSVSVSSIAVGKGTVYASLYSGGLAVIDCPNAAPAIVSKGKEPKNADFRFEYKNEANSHFHNWRPDGRYPVRSVAAKDNILYAACSYGGLAILRFNADGSAEKIGQGPQTFVEDVKIRGNRLYAAEGRAGLGIYEIIGPGELKEVERVNNIGNGSPFCLWVEVPNDDCIIASPRGAYYWIDAKNLNGEKSTAFIGRSAGWDRYVPNFVLKDNMYAHARPHLGLVWVDLSNGRPKIGKTAKSISINQRSGISNYKEGKAIVLIKNKLYVLEPGDQDLPESIAELKMNGAPMWDGENRLAITDRVGHSISLVDMTDDHNPKILFTEKTSAQPEMPIFHKGRLIVPCAYQGLFIQK